MQFCLLLSRKDFDPLLSRKDFDPAGIFESSHFGRISKCLFVFMCDVHGKSGRAKMFLRAVYFGTNDFLVQLVDSEGHRATVLLTKAICPVMTP